MESSLCSRNCPVPEAQPFRKPYRSLWCAPGLPPGLVGAQTPPRPSEREEALSSSAQAGLIQAAEHLRPLRWRRSGIPLVFLELFFFAKPTFPDVCAHVRVPKAVCVLTSTSSTRPNRSSRPEVPSRLPGGDSAPGGRPGAAGPPLWFLFCPGSQP